ncbi:creatininase family protein [Bradyrhizobium sp. U87765 SZCCT0131]|uniref:creatininase family protein n=1 Tax=unclassified Bradyrhizobium TaxID=2631580 RepID=UPI001BA8E2A5|nr:MULTISPECIES: creatininase family protein [unclassified Bradyrhizobium]MBR1217874.1 creatininase family protein [Bradyrhizobium sp. U87765 SZCCT0131]MBR1261180.1 creatininase family protein [Bradyrhizobium sp. U87765 SZCCT0134]MBR1303372.1 creatininase family protein [Bradyrhizobium sp. U87765 SZCCT0110]MBR1318978.1 creatininase family protein [Bradyrhizobium sp. U87765 SZCCT0109]MBR1347303.1 creatininase family protein [Bradyrhizobium sp. U87765 SZCCT0048]
MTVPLPDQLRLEFMSFEEVSNALAAGISTVLIPCGAVEQHGPHLPLCMDADHADALAEQIARRLADALIAPTIKVGCSTHHLGFSGTISLRPETFEAMCLDYCTSLARHGFKRILMFSGHIGNFPILRDSLPRLKRAVPQDVEIAAFCDSIAWIDRWRHAVAEAGGDADSVGGHADIAETALMMYLRPDSVRRDRFEVGHLGALSEEQLHAMWKNGIKSVTHNGIIGDPHGATADIGRRCLEAIADLLVTSFGE